MSTQTDLQGLIGHEEDWIGIAEMAERSGLSPDTLRWYEKEGLLPRVGRGPDGRRRYHRPDQNMLRLLTRLRACGMPTRDMQRFVSLLQEGAASHGRRVALLESTRETLERRRLELDATTAALDAKIRHYRGLIEEGRDCDGAPVPDADRPAQAAPDRPPHLQADQRPRPVRTEHTP